MDIKNLKLYLKDNPDKIISILEKLEFHHIQKHDGSDDDYITCGHPDGDNKSSVTIYLNDGLLVIDYTRDLCQNKESCDFLDLICFFRKDYNFFDNLKYVSEESGLGYYHDFNGNVPKSLLILKTLKELINKVSVKEDDDEKEIVPKDEKILSYYYPYVNDMFYEDGISYGTQVIFEVGLDPFSGFITIPIRDEIGTFCGVKGRYFCKEVPEGISKYYYLETFPKNKILYGYNITKNFIKESDCVYVTEAEKGVMKLWSDNYRNCVSTSGSKISKTQILKLSRLGKKIIFSYDKDVELSHMKKISNLFPYGVEVYSLYDKENILKDKESPHDNLEKFEYMLENCLINLRKDN